MQDVQQSMVAIKQDSNEEVKKDPNEEVKNDFPKEEEEQEMASFLELFRFATSIDYLFMALGTIAALAMGAALPSFAILWGSITDKFAIGGQALEEASRDVMLQFIYIGVATFMAGWAMFSFWMIAGERQAITCRKQYLKSLLKQQIGWFDKINQAQLASNFAADCFAYQGALGEKVSTIFMTLGMFIAGFVIAFVKGWLMTLVVLCSIPLIMIGGVMFAKATEGKDKVLKENYAKAGGIAEQAISAIKTVKLLNGEEFETNHYKRALKDVASKAARFAIFAGASMGFLFFAMLASYSLGFWFGSNCVEGASNCDPSLNNGSTYTAGDVIVIFFSILMAGFNLGQLTPALKKIAEGRSAATRIFKIIDRKSQIFSKEGAITPTVFKGVFKFNNVTFAYPKNPSKVILNNLNLTIDCNTAAFVGQSGCGKSTIFQLLMRFYDPNAGSITLDGNDLRDVDLYWLRQQLGYVGQEPVLFATTIRENLMFGKEDATDEEIIVALKKAEAYDFVMNQFTDKLDTNVGTSGGQLSGGQKQRIAIARALLKNPKVLLLDEATSALDRRNERLIQATLNKITSEQITMTIAHRIKTIMKSDKIFVITQGSVEEEGKFSDLKRFVGIKAEDDQEQEKNVQEVGEVEQKGEVQKRGVQLIIDEQRKKEQKKKEEEQEQKMLTDKYEEQIFSRVFSYASDQKCWFAAGVVSAIANGLIFPTFSIFLSKMLSILIKFLNDKATARTEANLYALVFLILAIISFFTNLFQLGIFTKIGQKITQNIRESVFAKILRMPVAWFDRPHNNSGALTVRLAEDCQSVNGLTTTYAAILIQNISTLLAGIIIAFIYEWRTSLVALALLPFMIICGVIQMKFMTGFSDKTGQAYEESSFLIVEAMVNIRTVTSFGYEDMIEHKYSSYLKEPMTVGIQKGNVSGVLFGLSQFVMFIVFGLIFYFGSVFINNFLVSVEDVFTAIYSLVFAGMTIGNNSHFIPDIGKAKNAAANLFSILDSEDEDQMQIREQSKMLKTPIKGDIRIQNISFKYETRSNHVFKNINLEIKQGQKVAFVGSSGCGKSTILQLLQRFYHAEEGNITIDGVNIADYDIHHLRACFGVVSQEPTLFNSTIGYNIKYNLASATQQQIKSAAIQSSFDPESEKIVIPSAEQTNKKKEAKNDFDESSDTLNGENQEGTGFNKNVGIKGSHISGGQKQRVAIARAIIRKPTILLLDEATSALDGQNQRKVQESLDRIMKNKTTITVAHRIDTIKNSDQIVVFDQGQIVERGRYEQLIAAKGKFYNLERGTQFL